MFNWRPVDIRRTVKETDNWRIPNKTGLGDTLVKRKIKGKSKYGLNVCGIKPEA